MASIQEIAILGLVWDELEAGFNPPGDEGLIGVAWGLGAPKSRAGNVVVRFGHLPEIRPLNEDETAKCRGFIGAISLERGFRSKRIPVIGSNELYFILRPVT